MSTLSTIADAIAYLKASGTSPIIVQEDNGYAALWCIEDCPEHMEELMLQASMRSVLPNERKLLYFNVEHNVKGFVIESI